MGLDLWFREDVARILAATFEVMQSSQSVTEGNMDYQQGFEDALRAVGVAFGVAAPRGGVGPVRRVDSGQAALARRSW